MWVQEQYSEYRQVPHSNPACYEFLQGTRTHAETTRVKVLKLLHRVSNRDASAYLPLLQGAESNEEEGPGPTLASRHLSGPRPAASAGHKVRLILLRVFEENTVSILGREGLGKLGEHMCVHLWAPIIV